MEERKIQEEIDIIDPNFKKKRTANLVLTFVFGVLTILATVYCVAIYLGNINIMHESGWGVLALIVTIPLFLIIGLGEIASGVLATVFNLICVFKFKLKTPLLYVYQVLLGLMILFPIVGFITLVVRGNSGSSSSSMSDVSESISMIKLLM